MKLRNGIKTLLLNQLKTVGHVALLVALFGSLSFNSRAQEYLQIGNDIDGQMTSEASGLATSLSADGQRIAVGSNFMGNNGLSPGLVRVYEWSNGSWLQLGVDIVGENMNDEFGTSVSLSQDGSRVAIGGPENGDAADRAGMVRVYEFSAGNWSQVGQDIDGTTINEGFGGALSISDNGERIVVGSPSGQTNGQFSGTAKVYEFDGSSWMQLGDALGNPMQGDGFGRSVSMNENGSRVAVGAPINDDVVFNNGKVEIFEWDNSTWNLVGNSILGDIESGASGGSIDLNADGTKIVIGANACGAAETQGTAKVYELTGGNWVQLGSLISGTNPISCFADSVAINEEGNRIVIGDPLQGPNGLTRVFELESNTWNQVGDDILGEAQGDLSGRSVTMSADGARIAMGANVNSDGAPGGGQVRVFEDQSLSVFQEEAQELSIIVWPNPASEIIQINNQQNMSWQSAQLFDLEGRLILKKTLSENNRSTSMAIDELAAGVYHLVVVGEGVSVVKKIIIQN